MRHAIGYGQAHASEIIQRRTAEEIVDTAFQNVRPQLIYAVQTFLESPISPTTFFVFEMAVLGLTREFGRRLVELVINTLEPENAEELPRGLCRTRALDFRIASSRALMTLTADDSCISRDMVPGI